MKLVKNIPSDSSIKVSYKGTEPSPLGRGYSARFESIGKKRVGLDKNTYIVAKSGNNKTWRFVGIRKQRGGSTDNEMLQFILDLQIKSQSKSSSFVSSLKKAVERYQQQLRDKKILQEAIEKIVVKIQDEHTNSASVVFESNKNHLVEFFGDYMRMMQENKSGIPSEILEDIKTKPSVVQIHTDGSESYGHGVARQLLKSCLNEAFNTFFKRNPISDRYYLNQDLSNKEISKILNIPITNRERQYVFIILGLLFVLCIKYGITIEHRLSRGILSMILYDENTNVGENNDTFDSLLYYLLEFKNTSLLNLLKENLDNSSLWEYVNVTDELKHPEYNVINNTNKYQDWLVYLSNTRLFHPTVENDESSNNDMTSFITCFLIFIDTYKLTKELDIFTLENLISQEPITIQNLSDLRYVVNKGVLDDNQYEKIKLWINELIDPKQAISNNTLKRVLRKYKQHVQDIPNIQKSNTLSISDEYFDFMKKLLTFWSGSDKIYENRVYEITSITVNGENAYPTASTCFFQLKLPHNIKSQEDLYDRLYVASQETSFALTGGRSKRRPRKKDQKRKSSKRS